VTRENSSLSFDGGVRVRELLSFFRKDEDIYSEFMYFLKKKISLSEKIKRGLVLYTSVF